MGHADHRARCCSWVVTPLSSNFAGGNSSAQFSLVGQNRLQIDRQEPLTVDFPSEVGASSGSWWTSALTGIVRYNNLTLSALNAQSEHEGVVYLCVCFFFLPRRIKSTLSR